MDCGLVICTYDALGAVGLLVQHEGHLCCPGIISILDQLHDDPRTVHIGVCVEQSTSPLLIHWGVQWSWVLAVHCFSVLIEKVYQATLPEVSTRHSLTGDSNNYCKGVVEAHTLHRDIMQDE